MSNQEASAYRFGDGELAAARLKRLAAVFEPSTREFLETLRSRSPRYVADLGCGPGYTSRLLADVFLQAKICGIDSSTNFISLARQAANDTVTFRCADVTRELPAAPFDLIYARYLLAHISTYRETVAFWWECLSPNGAIAIEENEWIETTQPTFRQYLAIVEAMLAEEGQVLHVGAELDAMPEWGPLAKASSELVPISIAADISAELFASNLKSWRQQAFIQRNYNSSTIDHLERELLEIARHDSNGTTVVFGRRRIVFTRDSV